MTESKKIEEVIEIFNKEFVCIKDKFKIYDVLKGEKLNEENILNSYPDDEYIWKPGVYVFCCNENVYRVGRHLTNSRKRAMQHIADYTKYLDCSIRDLENKEGVELLLFNVISENDNHWVAAVEIFFERTLNPIIKSRLG